ncbi:hypothetical protein Wenmar_03056 [Wenxinia marina DSM 24838]|uniref:Uncharacterized protein n=1 Tax=Wenxinia marina DSM 24838 TaxID=1123501 RepID=A0A0D0Q1E9_9RHOB|nr:hypothetical protein Wenmar_03056 [Wenxinia marina DSM 24838]
MAAFTAVWTEIPVTDLDAAARFHEEVSSRPRAAAGR